MKKLLKDHNPDMVVLTETHVGRETMEKIVESLPFNSFDTIDHCGMFVLILWNNGVMSFTVITKEGRAIHDIIKVQNSKPFFFQLFTLIQSIEEE